MLRYPFPTSRALYQGIFCSITMKQLKSLSIFFPAYNDEETIGQLVQNAYAIGSKIARSLEVIVINDGSKDNTYQVLIKTRKRFPGLKIVNHRKNRGYGGALQSGFKKATKEWVFY